MRARDFAILVIAGVAGLIILYVFAKAGAKAEKVIKTVAVAADATADAAADSYLMGLAVAPLAPFTFAASLLGKVF